MFFKSYHHSYSVQAQFMGSENTDSSFIHAFCSEIYFSSLIHSWEGVCISIFKPFFLLILCPGFLLLHVGLVFVSHRIDPDPRQLVNHLELGLVVYS